MAACSASMLAKGRAAHARSAIQGEWSKMSPRWLTNSARGMAERAATAASGLILVFMPFVILGSILDGCALGVPDGDQFAFVVGDGYDGGLRTAQSGVGGAAQSHEKVFAAFAQFVVHDGHGEG